MYHFIYLASKSPRRQELLSQIGIPFKLLAQQTNEQQLENEDAETFVSRLAFDKAHSSHCLLAQQNLENAPVLGSDTIVVCNHGKEILAKPKNKADVYKMLNLLSGVKHKVYTGICLTDGIQTFSQLSCSSVYFKTLTVQEIDRYYQSGESMGKAGGYAIQGKAAQFIRKISGSYSAIMGLPLYETSQLINKFDTSF